MLLAPIVWIFAVVIVVVFAAKLWWFPPAISEHGRSYDDQFFITMVVTGVIFLLAQVALGYVIFRFRDRGRRANYTEGNNKLEVLWTSAAAILFIGAVLISTSLWADVHFTPTSANALKIELMAKQFSWSFRYPGADGKFGRLDIKQINDAGGNPFGIDEKDPAGKDDITSSAIRVPAGRPILLAMRSRDVIHNFFVRELRVKQDIVPGMEIPLRFTAETPGAYEVACSELCGLGHHQMRSTLEVMPPDEFDKWLQAQAQALQAQQQQ
ncbi:MAG: cytochrome c oxidase subunit II [Bryobacteraceae bacterium]